jgi:hypothetical protein
MGRQVHEPCADHRVRRSALLQGAICAAIFRGTAPLIAARLLSREVPELTPVK